MDWSRAKNIIIIMLLLLNISLALVNYLESGNKYYLTKTQVDSIYNVLNDFDCTIDKSSIIRNFEPKKRIILEKYKFDETLLSKIFLGNEPKIDNQGGRIQIEDETGILYINDYGFQYYSTEENINEEIDRRVSENLCKDIIKKLGSSFKNFKLERIYKLDDNQLNFYYKDTFKNYTIDSNYIEFVVNSKGISFIETNFLKAISFEKDLPKDIVSSDEVLFSLAKYISFNGFEGKIDIVEVKLVYCEEDKEKTDNKTIFGVPSYAIYLKDEKRPILIVADPYNLKIL